MKKITVLLFLFVFASIMLQAQTKKITGTVTGAEDGIPIPGVSVLVSGTGTGITTDLDGKYTLDVPEGATSLEFSFVGMQTQVIQIGTSTIIDVVMESGIELEEVVVTALGITRDKKSLGYAVQEVKGDDISKVKSDNFVNTLSGKVSGVQIKRTTNMGGSTNVLIRGTNSLMGNNQALFVVDGVPISNGITNSRAQEQGLGGPGIDFGNAASDINPDDIESISVLKGAAASALYGSRASNGVIMITTKKGSKKASGIGITVNSGITTSGIDKSTFPEYQNQYSAGYGAYYDDPTGFFLYEDVDGDGLEDLLTPFGEDASYGAAIDPTVYIYKWDAFDSENPNYMTMSPLETTPNGPLTFFETPIIYSNSISIDNAFEKGSYRFSYANHNEKSLLPNSELKKNNFSLNMNYNLTDKLTVSGAANYIKTDAIGRNHTGYNDNLMSMWRQWWQTDLDIAKLKDAFFSTGRNVTWNRMSTTEEQPLYWDNPYWTRYKNYESDGRDRFIGNVALKYKLTDWLDVFGRVSVDSYDELQEERREVGSVATQFGIGTNIDGSIDRNDATSGYQRKDISFREFNYDIMFNYDYDFSDVVNIKGVVGANSRRNDYSWILSATNAGIGIPGLFSVQNTAAPLIYPKEAAEKIGVDGIYGQFSLGYNNFLFLDGSMRRDHSSTLPVDNSVYYYPSIASSFVFSKLVPIDWFSFGKLRMSYAEVGNSPEFDQVNDTYVILSGLRGAMSSVANRKKNADLKPERIKSIEGGLEMFFLNKRFGIDLSIYRTHAVDQILPVSISRTTGYSQKVINAGKIENKGIELSLQGTPIKASDFSWNIVVNWTANRNKVIELTEGLDNLQLGSVQQGITFNARVGEAYGVIQGTDYTYHDNGQRIIDDVSGEYIASDDNDIVIGNINPDWAAGISNSFSYKNWTCSFLIDIQKGGDIWSLDMSYGLGSGLYKETAFINDLGNPVRNTIAEGGGFVNKGVNEDGSVNTTRIRADRYGAFGYRRGLPNSAFIYDASFVKLREVAVSYDIPNKMLDNIFLTGASIGFVGTNLLIIDKNLPYADPEAGLGAGNMQGYQTGPLPTTRNFTFNVKLQF